MGPSINMEAAQGRVRGRRGETANNNDEGGKEVSRKGKLGEFNNRPHLSTPFSLSLSLSHTHTHTHSHRGRPKKITRL